MVTSIWIPSWEIRKIGVLVFHRNNWHLWKSGRASQKGTYKPWKKLLITKFSRCALRDQEPNPTASCISWTEWLLYLSVHVKNITRWSWKLTARAVYQYQILDERDFSMERQLFWRRITPSSFVSRANIERVLGLTRDQLTE
jgi:hypothetical protein